ncbi:hypothetical protein ACFVFS_39275 [Kitasatospora sp. NPDC057692]|uniref:hypothetical protein n=1 Tax=Kitasatospora sp. NPDC057692 TaxID=3346215 RepID=UPI0036854212
MPSALYHFTSLIRWSSIQKTGLLEPRSEQAVSFLDERPVLWLTDSPSGSSKTGVAADRIEVRVEVHPRGAVHPWALCRVEVPGSATNLDTDGSDPDSWFVTPEPVPLQVWSSAVDVATGEVLWSTEQAPLPLGPADGWSLADTELSEFQDFATTTVAKMAESGTLQDASLWQWTVQFLPRQVERVRAWAAEPNQAAQFRAWAGWRSLREKAEQLPGLPAKWTTM